eukprot:jgi/Mesvir1/23565/Mv18261-RA.1
MAAVHGITAAAPVVSLSKSFLSGEGTLRMRPSTAQPAKLAGARPVKAQWADDYAWNVNHRVRKEGRGSIVERYDSHIPGAPVKDDSFSTGFRATSLIPPPLIYPPFDQGSFARYRSKALMYAVEVGHLDGHAYMMTAHPELRLNGVSHVGLDAIKRALAPLLSGKDLYLDASSLYETEEKVDIALFAHMQRADGSVATSQATFTTYYDGDLVSRIDFGVDINALLTTKNTVPGPITRTPWDLLSSYKYRFGGMMFAAAAAGTEESWEAFKRANLADDILLRVAGDDVIWGPDDVAAFLREMYSIVTPVTFAIRGEHVCTSTIVSEYNSIYKRKRDGVMFITPCVDFYRWRGDKICEWRAYPDRRW